VTPKPLTYRHIIERARGHGGLLHDAVIKDHILGYLLAGIAATPGLGDRLAFKGGTALRKCWFPTYRYSEDLDFTLTDGVSLETDELVSLIRVAADRAIQLVPDYGARYILDARLIVPREPHPFDQVNIRLVGRAPSGAPVTVKIEITGTNEPVLLPVKERRVLHAFPEESLDATIRCYALEEIAAEKVRAGLQVRDRLNRFEERGRTGYAHRVRDVYDLWFLRTTTHTAVDWTMVQRILPAKARARATEWTSANDFRDERVRRLYREQWDQRLQGFVSDLPPFNEAWEVYSRMLDEVVAVPMETEHDLGVVTR
jgi:predicted nucleotidyltransferase component of viral defense system